MHNVGAATSRRLMMDPGGEFHSCGLTTYRAPLPKAHYREALRQNDIITVLERGAEPYRPQVTPSLQSDVLLHIQIAQLWFERLNHMLMHPGCLHASDPDLLTVPSSRRGPRMSAFRTYAANLTAIDTMIAIYWAFVSGPPTRPRIHGGNAFMLSDHAEKHELQSERRAARRSRRATLLVRVTRVSPVAFTRWFFNLHFFMFRTMMVVSFGYHLLCATTCGSMLPLLSHVLTAPAAATYVSILALYLVYPTLTTHCGMLLLHACVHLVHTLICSTCLIIYSSLSH